MSQSGHEKMMRVARAIIEQHRGMDSAELDDMAIVLWQAGYVCDAKRQKWGESNTNRGVRWMPHSSDFGRISVGHVSRVQQLDAINAISD